MNRIDLKLGFDCNNKCLFCVQGTKRSRHKRRPLGILAEYLKEGIEKGAESLVLTGGEPTLHPKIFDVVRLANSLGYKNIQIQTNGRRFAYLSFCKAMIDAGATEFSPALHASNADIHDSLTRSQSSWEQSVRGIENLVGLGQKVITNSVITRRNHLDMPALAAFLVGLGVQQYQLAFVHITGSAFSNSAELVPRKSEVIPLVKRALDVGRGAGIPSFTEAIPYCLMQGYEEHIAESFMPNTRIYDTKALIPDYAEYRRTQGKSKGPECKNCLRDTECEGPWKEYPDLFGWDEFLPIRA